MATPKWSRHISLPVVTLLSCSVAFSSAFIQTFTVYELGGESGNSITFRRKTPDLTAISGFIDTAQGGACNQGYWKFYAQPNYTDYYRGYYDYSTYCYSTATLAGVRSARHAGTPDTETPAITLYKDGEFENEELVINYASESAIPFHSQSAFFTGRANWTLYERPGFGGPSVCFESSQQSDIDMVVEINYLAWGISTVGSVRRGCDDVCVAWKPARRVQAEENDKLSDSLGVK